MTEEKLRLEDLLKSSPTVDDSDSIKEIAIIGAGIMGQGIAQTISSAGMDVCKVLMSLFRRYDRFSDGSVRIPIPTQVLERFPALL